jgi:hypothetical protein
MYRDLDPCDLSLRPLFLGSKPYGWGILGFSAFGLRPLILGSKPYGWGILGFSAFGLRPLILTLSPTVEGSYALVPLA